ncbi:MAG TPA: hypothetical protein VG733_14960, partial [Chthoniobacteraceae bacterium]|nr:hypothetical protein [Chthoniobacteraceae bacterium]
ADNPTLDEYFQWQLVLIDVKRAAIDARKKKLDDYVSENSQQLEASLSQAQKIDKVLGDLAKDVVELAKTDPNAQQVLDNMARDGIKFNPPAPSPTPSPAP